MIARYIFCVLFAYLAGSWNPAITLSKRVLGKDIRTVGSGNPGTTNVQRVMGNKYAAINATLDLGKTMVAILLAQLLCEGFDFQAGLVVRLVAGTAAVIGHIWPVWYGFRGGKGVMTGATTALFFHPLMFLACITVFAVTVALTRYISLGSILGNLTFPVLLLIFYPGATVLNIMGVLIPLIVVVKHRSNIIRLFNGTENKIRFKKKSA